MGSFQPVPPLIVLQMGRRWAPVCQPHWPFWSIVSRRKFFERDIIIRLFNPIHFVESFLGLPILNGRFVYLGNVPDQITSTTRLLVQRSCPPLPTSGEDKLIGLVGHAYHGH
jgi:hypothetical protein